MHSDFFFNPKVRHSIRSDNNDSKRKAIDFSVCLIRVLSARSSSFKCFPSSLHHAHAHSCRVLLSQSLTTGSIKVWSWLLCPSTKKGEELRYEEVLWMETPAEETPGGWSPCYKGSAAFGLVLIMASLLLLVACQQDTAEARPLHSPVSGGGGGPTRPHSPHRKLLRQESTVIDQPSRLPGGECMRGDIVVIQGASIPLPNGIPAYSVEIINQCPSGCAISAIHLSCGWFSSAHLVNPRVFRRLRYDDCLVNNGMPLHTRETLSFLYANTYPYPLSVSSVSCS